MPYEVRLTKTAQKVYEKLPVKLQTGIDRCLASLEIAPKNNPNVKKLKGYPNDFRYQVGGWRVLYEVDEPGKVVTVYDIRPRGDIY
jgi:mRNA interferase RelE/StbE